MLPIKESNPSRTARRKERRTYAWSLALTLLAVLLTACGSNANQAAGDQPSASDGAPSKQTSQPAQTDSAEAAANPEGNTTKSVKHDYGETVIPVHPKRIVSYLQEDILLALDVPLVLAYRKEGDFLYEELQAKNVPTFQSGSEPNYEAVLDAQPDLIIISSGFPDQAAYEKLSKIAPTLAYDRDQWQESILKIGQALDLEDEANAILQAYQDKLKQARETIIQTVGADKTVALVRTSEKEAELFFPDFSFGSVLYHDLGLTPATSITDLRKTTEETWGITLSLEKLPELTADYLFVTAGGSMSPPEVYQKALDTLTGVEKLQVWKAIPAVKQNHKYNVSARRWMLSGPIADSAKIDDVVQALTDGK